MKKHNEAITGAPQYPFPKGSCLDAWYEEWLAGFDKNKSRSRSRNLLAVQTRVTQLLRDKILTENKRKWERLAHKLVLIIKKVPTVIEEKRSVVALELQHTFTKNILLFKNLDIQAA